MKKIDTYEQYCEVLSVFKEGRAKCKTNKLMTKDEIAALVEAGKLYYAEIDGVLWFFVNEGYFYSANFYVPADTPIRMSRQDMDVMVELTGNQTRYNGQWEQELIAAGYEKQDKRIEFLSHLDDVIDYIRKQNQVMHAFLERQGFTYRKALKSDYPEIRKIWEEKLGRHRYVITDMTDTEWDEIERNGWCDVICDPENKIVAVYVRETKNTTAYGFHAATLYQGSGLGSSVYYENMISAYEEGCTKFVAWIREDNKMSIRMHRHTAKPTGKFYWQFVYRTQH